MDLIRPRIHRMDTEAAGIWHPYRIIRWTEDTEAELHRRPGTIETELAITSP